MKIFSNFLLFLYRIYLHTCLIFIYAKWPTKCNHFHPSISLNTRPPLPLLNHKYLCQIMSSSPSLQWLNLVGTIWLQSTNGANSDFPVYSSQFKQLLSISQIQLNNLSFASDAGKLLGWFSGIAATYLHLRLVLLIGAALSFIGYGVQYLFLANRISHLAYWQVFLLTSLAGNGICWINTVCYLICIRNFSLLESPVAVGISTSYVGLSARLYTALADSIFHPEHDNNKAKAYLLLNAVCPLLVTSVVSPLLRVVDNRNNAGSSSAFVVMFLIAITTGACSVFGSIGSASSGFWSREHMNISLGVLLITPVLLPVFVSFRQGIENKKENRVHDFTVDENGGGDRAAVAVLKNEEVKDQIDFKLMLSKLDFWLYFFGYMFSATLGMVFLNNLGQITQSRGLSHTSSLVSLSSSFGFFGRLLPSILDYYVGKRGFKISRTGLMATMTAPISISFFLLLNSGNLILYASTAIIGACSGAITTLAVSATTELFGTQHFAMNHNIVVANIPIGSFLFGYMAAVLYQKEGGTNICFGAGCYNKTFIICGSFCSLGTFLAVILYARVSGIRSMVSKIETKENEMISYSN